MLINYTYSRKELEQIYATNRLDAIKRKLNSDGYTYTTCGRGDNFTLTITACKNPFKAYCKEELGFAPQTDFNKLQVFLNRLFNDVEFARLPFAAMERECGITSETLSKWIKHLCNQNLITVAFGEFVYYSTRRVDNNTFETVEITEQQYKDAWKAYWEDREDGYFLSVNRMYNTIQGTPHKRGRIVENAFETERLDKLKELLKENNHE